MELGWYIFAAFYLWGNLILLAHSLFATAVHGGQELVGWWGRWQWWLFLIAQSLFVVLAVVGLLFCPPVLWVLVALRVADGVGFHLVFYPRWPGRDTAFLPLADAAFLSLWMVA